VHKRIPHVFDITDRAVQAGDVFRGVAAVIAGFAAQEDRKSTRLNSSHRMI
jgi:hypothetical protein